MREPVSHYRSVYNYYYTSKEHRTDCFLPCWNEPWMSFLDTKLHNVSFENFLEELPGIFDPNRAINFRAKNFQAFEMGMDHLNDNDKYIKKNIEALDEQFDLGNDFK